MQGGRGPDRPAAMISLNAGDTDAVAVMTNRHRVPETAFDQVLDLEVQMRD